VPAFEAALERADVSYERHLYPDTQHGFHNDTTPRHHEAAAMLAWQRTLAFLTAICMAMERRGTRARTDPRLCQV
jgi:carboxymethylenebutenolidase